MRQRPRDGSTSKNAPRFVATSWEHLSCETRPKKHAIPVFFLAQLADSHGGLDHQLFRSFKIRRKASIFALGGIFSRPRHKLPSEHRRLSLDSRLPRAHNFPSVSSRTHPAPTL